jgi:hypothetical protein
MKTILVLFALMLAACGGGEKEEPLPTACMDPQGYYRIICEEGPLPHPVVQRFSSDPTEVYLGCRATYARTSPCTGTFTIKCSGAADDNLIVAVQWTDEGATKGNASIDGKDATWTGRIER